MILNWQKMKADKRRKWSLDRARELAKARGGELLSSKYINTVVKLIWKCKNGHVLTLLK